MVQFLLEPPTYIPQLLDTCPSYAGGGTDFGSPTPSTFTFMTSQTTQCTDIPINNDLLVEGSTDETFNIMLAQIVPADPNTQLSPATAIVSIDDNDGMLVAIKITAVT